MVCYQELTTYTLYTHEHFKKIMFISSNWQQWSKTVEHWELSSIIDEWSQVFLWVSI